MERAIIYSGADPAASLLEFKEVLENKKHTPNAQQKAWLDRQIESLRPQAVANLQADYDAAARELDLRGMIIASAVANKIGKDSIKATPAMAETQKQLLTGVNSSRYVWSVSEATSSVISGDYEEEVHGSQRLTLQPKPGFQILRVKAAVTNVNHDGDRLYASWAWGGMKRMWISIGPAQAGAIEISRWLDSEFIFLAGSESELIPCAHVCEGSGLREASMTISGPAGGGLIMTPPKAVKSGESVKVDVLFMIPQAKSNYRLLIFGAPPTALTRSSD
ncbi:MAG: hypothetical protein ACREEM_29785 [Blastocatellia bacterium]